jgi:hypothetical protein
VPLEREVVKLLDSAVDRMLDAAVGKLLETAGTATGKLLGKLLDAAVALRSIMVASSRNISLQVIMVASMKILIRS